MKESDQCYLKLYVWRHDRAGTGQDYFALEIFEEGKSIYYFNSGTRREEYSSEFFRRNPGGHSTLEPSPRRAAIRSQTRKADFQELGRISMEVTLVGFDIRLIRYKCFVFDNFRLPSKPAVSTAKKIAAIDGVLREDITGYSRFNLGLEGGETITISQYVTRLQDAGLREIEETARQGVQRVL